MAFHRALLLLQACLIGNAMPSAALGARQSGIYIQFAGSMPADISPTIDSSFPGFAFEETSLPLYAGSEGKPNILSQNLLNQVAIRTRTQPSIRVGGTSLDNSRYVPGQSEAIKFPPGQVGNVPSDVTIGPTYFRSFANFPRARYTWNLPLAKNNLSNTVAFASAGFPIIKSQVDMLEIGNEPQTYPGSVRPASYSPANYIAEITTFSNAVNKALGISNNDAIYQAVSLGSPAIYETSNQPAVPGPFYPNALFEAGLAKLAPRFASVSLHYYQTRANPDVNPRDQLRYQLMNHTITTRKMAFFEPAIKYFAKNYPKIPVDLAEVASSLNGATNAYDLEQTFGAALWQVDFMLWAMKLGIRRINWQQIAASAFDLWQPVLYRNREPAVLPPYYAMLFAADFIGTAGDTRVANLDLQSSTHVAYAAYNSGRLSRVALINLAYWSQGAVSRPSQMFTVKAPFGAKAAQIRRLTSDEGAVASRAYQITWAGSKWTLASNGLEQRFGSEFQKVPVVAGLVRVSVRASEAAMLTFTA